LQIVFFKKFFGLTKSFENGENHLVGIFNIWNFLFYISIGLAIVFAVRVTGVILVFSFLIIPSVSEIMLSRTNVGVFIISFVISVLGSFFGLLFCYKNDFPAGSSIVAVLGAIFIIASIYKLLSLAFVKRAR